MTDKDWQELKQKLADDGRFEKYVLGEAEQEYVSSRGMAILRLHATDFVNKRLAPANPKNDGRQTPTKGHPVFIAQHACGCSDRGSLAQFYHIEKGRTLTSEEVELIVNVILTWIEENIKV